MEGSPREPPILLVNHLITEELTAVGPVDVYIIGFPGNKFTGQIAPAIMEQVENGDLDAETGAAFMAVDIAQPGALGPEGADEVSEDLPLNSSAMLIAFENRWAEKIVAALRDAEHGSRFVIRNAVDLEARMALADAGLTLLGVFDEYTSDPVDASTLRATWVPRRGPAAPVARASD